MSDNPPIFLLSGSPGAGKTSVAIALMQRFPSGIHIPVDDLREWVVAGIAHPVPVWTDETGRQFSLARQSAAFMAKLYADAGFAVAIDDVLQANAALKFFVEPLQAYTVHKVLLRPRPEMLYERNAHRTNKAFDTTILLDTIRELQQTFMSSMFVEQGWIVIDSSDLSIEGTVNAILEQI